MKYMDAARGRGKIRKWHTVEYFTRHQREISNIDKQTGALFEMEGRGKRKRRDWKWHTYLVPETNID